MDVVGDSHPFVLYPALALNQKMNEWRRLLRANTYANQSFCSAGCFHCVSYAFWYSQYVPIRMSQSEGLLQSPGTLALIIKLITQKGHSDGAFSLALPSYPVILPISARLQNICRAQTSQNLEHPLLHNSLFKKKKTGLARSRLLHRVTELLLSFGKGTSTQQN